MEKPRRMLQWVLVSAVVSSGCASVEGVRAKNREGLSRLSRGMAKAEVLSVMGTKSVTAQRMRITNPWRVETREAGGLLWEILFYYTDMKRADYAITDDELTPLILKDGKLDGWGWSYLDDVADKYEIRLR